MEAGEENSSNVNLKRQREPLSDSEDNINSAPAISDAQKRRRLEAAGQENRSPKPTSSERLPELETKPDTPIVPSVRSRVHLLTQRRDGGAHVPQRCLSDPGALESKGLREQLLTEGQFSQRMERFKAPASQVSPNPTPSPIRSCPRTRSDIVSDIQQKLQSTTTPSSKQATRMRQERELELNQMQFQPISENAWLKRSSSDSLLTQGRTPTGSSSPFSWVPRSQRRVWPPVQPWDQVHGDAEMKDGSFTEASVTDVEKPSVDIMGDEAPFSAGQRAPSASETPASSAQLEGSCKEQEPNTPRGEEDGQQKEHSLVNDQKHQAFQQPENQTILKLSFSEDQNLMGLPTAEKQSFLESTALEESDTKEAKDVCSTSEEDESVVFAFDEEDTMDISSFGEDEIEPSTDEELKMWSYPQRDALKDDESVIAEQYKECTKEEGVAESSRLDKERNCFTIPSAPTDIQDGKCPPADVSSESVCFPEKQGDEKPKPEPEKLESEICIKDSVKDGQGKLESGEGCLEDTLAGDHDVLTTKQEQKTTERCARDGDTFEQSGKSHAVCKDVAPTLKETQMENADHEKIIQSEAGPLIKAQAALSVTNRNNDGQSLTEIQASDPQEMEQESGNGRQEVVDELAEETCEVGGRESSKRVTFILEPELINSSAFSETDTSMESRTDTSLSDAGLNSHDETHTAEIIDQMFEEVLEYAGRVENDRRLDEDGVDRDSGIVACSGGKDNGETEVEKSEDVEAEEEGCDQNRKLESGGDELLTFPPAGILSPLSKSVEAVVTPLRLAASQESNPSSLLLTPDETSTTPAESALLYSIDAYRSQRQKKLPTIQSVTPAVQRRAPDTSKPQTSVNTKEKIAVLNEEAGKLQTVINQTLQALSCCTDEEHGRGSLEEAEAEKLLLVSCEKHSALVAEVARLREDRSSESEEAAKEDTEYISQQPCRGTVSITNIQLPLKVEFVCSSHNRTGRPSHYFFVLIRYGPYNVVATPLATAADARNGDTISFSTSVTLKDIRPSFEIEVEVYSLAHASATSCSVDRTTTKSRVTPRKLLNTFTRSSNSLTGSAPVAINTRRTSNFCLVGSHKITLASLEHSKFPLDKMKFEGKIRRLLGDEFQEKVPFLSPLEGNIYLQLDSKSHSNIHHQGFLTMFELISGFGVWHRRYFVLEGCNMYYWNHPNDRETKEADGSISLSRSPSQCVRPVKRDSCARPFTFELVSNITQQQDHNQDAFSKCWFSADTKQERLDWMEKLSQVLLDFHTWNRTQSESQQTKASSSGNLRESML